MVLITGLFAFGEELGMQVVKAEMPYVDTLFDNTRVHTLDIVVEASDWQSILDNPMAKEYIACTTVIDGEKVANVGIRTKGNSSLSSIAMSDTDRYSFKVEFDHYVSGKTYQGLDKLALNNIAQDNTYLKDYLSYQLMVAFDADAPLCSFIWITVNGEDWGLYLAVEAIEDSFVERTYGSDFGQLYKPDNMNMGGGGNRDENRENREGGQGGGGFMNGGGGGFGEMPEISEEQMAELMKQIENGEEPDFAALGIEFPGGGENAEAGDTEAAPEAGGNAGGGAGGRGGGGFGGMGASDVKLIYTDDDPDSYSSIFNSAKFDLSESDKTRLIESLRKLNAGEDLEEVVNVDEVLRYFVVHNFVLNFDSYTGSMIHNYYLYEQDGQLSMIAWDYNLAFGAFSMGRGTPGQADSGSDTDEGTSMVNYPIDSPVSGGTAEDRPMLYQMLINYPDEYHALFSQFIEEVFDSGWFEALFDDTVALITPYVEKDPSSFTTFEKFEAGTESLRELILLRAESVRG